MRETGYRPHRLAGLVPMLAVLLGFAAIAATGASPTARFARPETVATGDSVGSQFADGAAAAGSAGGIRGSLSITDLGPHGQAAPRSIRGLGTLASPDPAAPAAQAGGIADLNPGIGGTDAVLTDWFLSHHQDRTVARVSDAASAGTGEGAHLEVTAASSRGGVAQDVDIRPQAGHTYSAAVRAKSMSGFPVLVELAVHALDDSGAIGDTKSRLVMVEGDEVPITVTLEPTSDHASLRAEVYVHTVDRTVELGDVSVLVDDRHGGPVNLGYQQPRVRYLDDPLTGPVDLADLSPGGRYRVEVSVDTTTDQPWRCCPDLGAIRLGTEDEDLVGGSGRASVLYTPPDIDGSAWISPNRISFDRAESTFGGSFVTTITAPTEPGPFAERFRLVSEHVTWLPGPVIEIIGSVTAPPVSETPVDSEDGQAALVVECPPNLSLAAPDSSSTDCAVDVDGFSLAVTEVGAGYVSLSWLRPTGVTGKRFLVEIEDRLLPDGPERRNGIHTVEIVSDDVDPAAPVAATVDLAPGSYAVRVLGAEDSGRLVRSQQVPVEVLDPAPIFEAVVPTIGCRSENGVVLPGFCPPDDGPVDPPAGDDPPVSEPPTPPAACRTARLFFGNNALMRYPDHDRSDPLPIRLPCTRYEIVLRSTDPHHATGYQSDQTDERWYLEVLGPAGQIMFTSETTPDLPDHQTEREYTVGVADLTGAAAVVARHTGEGTSANSVVVSAELRPID